MTNREKEIFDLICKRPMISQKEVADILGIQRSSVAVHILNLMKKGRIMGKGYIVNEEDYVLVIGGSNVDIAGFPKNGLRSGDSVPGKVKISSGGVGRNICENMARLGLKVKLMTAVGHDVHGKKILSELNLLGVDTEASLVCEHHATSTYLSVNEDHGDMQYAISDMGIMDELSPEYLSRYSSLIRNASVIVLDTNIGEESLEYLFFNFPDATWFVDPVSVTKSHKLQPYLKYIHTLKPNIQEGVCMMGLLHSSESSAEEVIRQLAAKGVKNTFISLGKEGVAFNQGQGQGQTASQGEKIGKLVPPQTEVINANGAGDAFMAGLVYAYLNRMDKRATARFASAMSMVTIGSEETISNSISVEKIESIVKEMASC